MIKMKTLTMADTTFEICDEQARKDIKNINPAGAKVGQTIIVEEVDDSGKPIKWKAADYQEKTHYIRNTTHRVASLPETSFYFEQIGDNLYQYTVQWIPEYDVDKQYFIKYDGTEYCCTAQTLLFDNNFDIILLGNGSLAAAVEPSVELPDTGEPFLIALIPASLMTAILVQSDINTHIFSVEYEEPDIQAIPSKFLPEGVPFREWSYKTIAKDQHFVISSEEYDDPIALLAPIFYKGKIGSFYEIIFDGTQYNSVCQEYQDGCTLIGNAGAISVEQDTGEPFMIISAPPEFTGTDTGYTVIFAKPGMHTITIRGEFVMEKAIDTALLPKDFMPVKYIEAYVDSSNTSNYGITIMTDNDRLETILENSQPVLRLYNNLGTASPIYEYKDFHHVGHSYGTHRFSLQNLINDDLEVETIGVYISGGVRYHFHKTIDLATMTAK